MSERGVPSGRRAPRRGGRLAPVLLLLSLLGCTREPPPALGDLDVVLVVLDTLRADRTPLDRPELGGMPFLRGLAARSVVFENAYSTSSYTAPATASLFTSRHPSGHGVWNGIHATLKKQAPLNTIPAALRTLPELLSAAGFRTFGVADNINIGELMGFSRGFDRFAHFEYESADAVNRAVTGWADEIREAERSFLYLHYMDPHQPYHERRSWLRPGSAADHLTRLRAQETLGSRELRKARSKLEAYDSELGYADARLRALYEGLGWDQGTLLIVTSDHGEEFYDHGRTGHGFRVYQELVRVPLLVLLPGVAPRRVAAPVSLLDVLPTLREVAGLPPDPGDRGRSLLPLLRSEALPERPLFAMRLANWDGVGEPSALYSVLSGSWKYILRRPSGKVELYDLARDPGEQRDLSRDHPDVVRDLDAELAGIRAELRTTERSFVGAPDLDADTREGLRALGYLE